MRIPITKPLFGEGEEQAVLEPLRSGWIVQGPRVEEFERRFAEFIGVAHAAATTSCTTALHLALVALDVKPGDEVIVPAFTWISTANVVEYMGAKPVFCDIELQTFNIDVSRIDELITDNTVGIIPVHLFGLCAEMRPIQELADRHGLWTVEDAACAFGSWYHDRHAGTFGDFGAFSFHPRKSITTGEGGMVTTGDAQRDELVRSLREHGASRSDLARHDGKAAFLLPDYEHIGFNYRMTDLQGALGCAQMDRAAAILAQKTAWARLYDEFLADLDWLRAPVAPDGFVHGYQAYVCLFAPEEPSLAAANELHARRNEFMMRLEGRGIATRQGTHAAALQGAYVCKYGNTAELFPAASLAERLSVALPLYPHMSESEHAAVCSALVEEFSG